MQLELPPSFSEFIGRYLPGKVQKISVNAALSCPNRDGTKGRGGCTYCNNASFSPAYTRNIPSIKQQIDRGREFFRKKYPDMRYLAYFQSYTSTNGEIPQLTAMFEEALYAADVDGLIVGTRPDCIPQQLLEWLAELSKSKFVMMEYGAESSHDATLQRINRCHTWKETVDAVRRTHEAGLPTGLHFIMGLPGESTSDMLTTIDRINDLPVDMVKFHQLQIIRGTRLAKEAQAMPNQITTFDINQYLELCCDIIERLRKDIAVERFVSQSPDELLISPRWGVKNYQFTEMLRKRLKQRNQLASEAAKVSGGL